MFSKILIANRGEVAVRVITGLQGDGRRDRRRVQQRGPRRAARRPGRRGILHRRAPPPGQLPQQGGHPHGGRRVGRDGHPPRLRLSWRRTPSSRACAASAASCSSAPRPRSSSAWATRTWPASPPARQACPSAEGCDLLTSADQAESEARRIGCPVLIKARAGGGGRGIRRVDSPEAARAAYQEAYAEALAAFGDGECYMEKFIEHAHHVEVQLLCDAHGHALAIGERECSVQRRNQKLLEESPCALPQARGPHGTVGRRRCASPGRSATPAWGPSSSSTPTRASSTSWR